MNLELAKSRGRIFQRKADSYTNASRNTVKKHSETLVEKATCVKRTKERTTATPNTGKKQKGRHRRPFT